MTAIPRDAIVRWMHEQAIPLAPAGRAAAGQRGGTSITERPRARSAPTHRRTPFDQIVRPSDVPTAFASGALLCVLVERLKGSWTAVEAPCRLPDRISGVDDHPRTTAAKVSNFDAALGAMRDDAPLPRGQRRWLAATLARGDHDALWLLLSCLYLRYPPRQALPPSLPPSARTGAWRDGPQPTSASSSRSAPSRSSTSHHPARSPTRRSVASATSPHSSKSTSGPKAAEAVMPLPVAATVRRRIDALLPSLLGAGDDAASMSTPEAAAAELAALIAHGTGSSVSEATLRAAASYGVDEATAAAAAAAFEPFVSLRATLHTAAIRMLKRLSGADGGNTTALHEAICGARAVGLTSHVLTEAIQRLSNLTAAVGVTIPTSTPLPDPLRTTDNISSHATAAGLAATSGAAVLAAAGPAAATPRTPTVPNLVRYETDAGRGLVHAWLRSTFRIDVADATPLKPHTGCPAVAQVCTSLHPVDDPMCNGILLHAVATRLPTASWRRRAPPPTRGWRARSTAAGW